MTARFGYDSRLMWRDGLNLQRQTPFTEISRPMWIIGGAMFGMGLGLLILTMAVAQRWTDAAEMPLVMWALAQRTDRVTTLIQVLTFFTSATPALLFASGAGLFEWCVAGERFGLAAWRQTGLQALRHGWPVVAYVGSLACNIGLRIWIGRLRPEVDYIPHLLPEIQAGFQRYSFPSGHAGAATVACWSWVIVLWPVLKPYRRARWIAFVLALLIWLGTGFGRFYLGVHWPTDVLGGYLLAGAWLCAALLISRHSATARRVLENKGP